MCPILGFERFYLRFIGIKNLLLKSYRQNLAIAPITVFIIGNEFYIMIYGYTYVLIIDLCMNSSKIELPRYATSSKYSFEEVYTIKTINYRAEFCFFFFFHASKADSLETITLFVSRFALITENVFSCPKIFS